MFLIIKFCVAREYDDSVARMSPYITVPYVHVMGECDFDNISDFYSPPPRIHKRNAKLIYTLLI